MHHWGDEGVDWQGIDEAAYYIGRFISRYGRISVSQTKEKWGCACVYCYAPQNWYQIFIYRLAYRLAIKKWPHLKEEILEGADWADEYLKDF
jgi:hypothetical protein